jgi:hypothetical protein
MPPIRKRHIQKDTKGRIVYERVEEACVTDDGIENIITESGMDNQTRLRWFELLRGTLELEQKTESQEERNRILEKDVDRKAIRDREDIALGQGQLKLHLLEIKQNLGIEKAKLWLKYALTAWQMKREKVELEFKGQRLALDKKKLEAYIGIAAFRALTEYKKAKHQWLHNKAIEAIEKEKLTLQDKIEGMKLLLAREQLEHDRTIDLKKITISEDEAEREWARLTLDQQVEAEKLRLRANADSRDERRFLQEVKMDGEKLALAKEAETRLKEALSWQKTKEGAEIEIAGKRYELDSSKFMWGQTVDTEKLRQGGEQLKLGWADFDLKERTLSHQQRTDVTKLEQEAQRILLAAREVRSKEKLTNHTIEMGVRKDDRDERTLQADIVYKGRKLQQGDRHLDQEDHRIAQGDQRIAIKAFEAKSDAEYKVKRLSQHDRELDQGDRRLGQQDQEIAIKAFNAKTDAVYKEKKASQADRQLDQRDKDIIIQAFRAKTDANYKSAQVKQADQKRLQEDKRIALDYAKAKSHFQLEGVKHQEAMRHNRRTEELREGEITLDALKTFGELSKNQAIEHAQLAKAHTEEIKGVTEVMGEARRFEEMKREQDRADREQVIDEKQQKEELKLKERKAEMDFETRIKEIERREGRDQQYYAVKTLSALIREKQVDNEYKIEAKKLRNDIVKAGFRSGTQVINGVLKLLGSVAMTAGHVASSAISAAGKIASSAIRRG